ncbi:MAG: hypothetical protein ACOH2E_04730 [Candidatus Paracaedibacter sp.]
MMRRFLTLTTIIIGMSSIFGMEQKTPGENISPLIVSQSFNFELADQTDLNKWVAKNGAEIYHHLNNHPNFGYPEEIKEPHYYTLSENWYASHSYGENQVDFIKKKDILASVAIRSLLVSEGRFDCRIAQRIVFLECMRRLMGDMTFDECNKQFEAELSQDVHENKDETRKLHLCGGITLNPYYRFSSQKECSLYSSGTPGYFGYIPNIKEYATLHPYGLLRGDHGLLCSDPEENEETVLYVGYGSFYKDGGLLWDAVVARFKKVTLTLSLPEKAVIDEDKRTNPRLSTYVKQIEKLHASTLQRHKDFIESSHNTYEKNLEERQIDFCEPAASYFIDLNNLKWNEKGMS